MRLSARVLALVAALWWGGCVLFVGLVNLGAPSYDAEFLRMMSSVYPGFHDTRIWGEIIPGTIYGLVDGAIAGLLFAWLYNWVRTGQDPRLLIPPTDFPAAAGSYRLIS
jgi:hypothetical protein